MAIITKIEAQKKNDDRVNIYINDTFFMSIYKELVFTLGIKKGSDINEDNLREIIRDEMYVKAKNKALNILSKADQSEKNIRTKLSTDFEEDIIDDVIDFLKKYNFINDEILAQRVANTNIKLNKYGKNKIKQNLYNKGINKITIDETLSNLDNNDEFENAMYLAKKRYDRIKNEDKHKIYQKIAQHLTYKGFEYDIVKKVLNKLLNFDEYNY